MKKRICTECRERKPLNRDFYHLDVKGKDGYSAKCKICRQAKRKIKGDVFQFSKNMIGSVNPFSPENLQFMEDISTEFLDQDGHKIEIIGTPENLWHDEMNTKYNCHWNLSVNNDRAVLQIHKNPDLIFKGTPEEVIEKALAY